MLPKFLGRWAAVVAVWLLLGTDAVFAQCAMCRAVLQTSGDTGQAEAINDGIVYLMVVPYILVAVLGFAIYRSRKKIKKSA